MPSDPDVLLRRLTERLLKGPGTLDPATRREAIRLEAQEGPWAAFASKLARGETVTGDDVAILRSAGWSQEQVIELTVCIALGVAQARMKAGLAALEDAIAW